MLQNCVREDFLVLQKCLGFWPLSILTLNFSVVVKYVIVRSFRKQRLKSRTDFHIHFRLFRTHAGTARFRAFILNCVQCVVRCLVHVSLLSSSYNGKKKTYTHGRTEKQVFLFPKWLRGVGSRMLGM
jgi:hypothetical protein